MKTDKWTSLSSVIPFILDSIDDVAIDEGLILEWAYNALDEIETHPMTITDIKFLEVKDFKVKLPCNFHKLEMTIYNAGTISSSCNEVVSCTNTLDTELGFYNNAVKLFYNLNARGWQVMKKSTNKFDISINECSGSLNQLYKLCEQTGRCKEAYQLVYTANGTIMKTTFKEGIIGVSYRAKIMDCNEYLIPDDSQFKNALKSYCMKNIWESRWNAKEEGSSERFNYYSSDWAIKKAVIKGKYNMPDSEELEQIRIQRTKLVPMTEQFNKMFSDLDTQQGLTMLGKNF